MLPERSRRTSPIPPQPTGIRTQPRSVPGGDAAAYVSTRLAAIQPDVTATIRIHAPLAEVEEKLRGYAHGLTAASTSNGEPVTDWRIADTRTEVLAAALIWLTWPLEILDSPQLSSTVRDRAARFAASVR